MDPCIPSPTLLRVASDFSLLLRQLRRIAACPLVHLPALAQSAYGFGWRASLFLHELWPWPAPSPYQDPLYPTYPCRCDDTQLADSHVLPPFLDVLLRAQLPVCQLLFLIA